MSGQSTEYNALQAQIDTLDTTLAAINTKLDQLLTMATHVAREQTAAGIELGRLQFSSALVASTITALRDETFRQGEEHRSAIRLIQACATLEMAEALELAPPTPLPV